MGQGSINQFVPNQRSPIEGIANALKAVNEYYGIDTTKAQAKLAETQAKTADLENKSKQSAAEGNPDALWRSEHGQTPLQTISLKNLSPDGSPSLMPVNNSKPMASNGNGVNDIGPSVLASAVSQMKDPNAIKNATGITYNPNGTATVWGLDNKHSKEAVELTNAELETTKKRQEITKGQVDAKRAQQTIYAPAVTEFDKEATPIRTGINDVAGAQKSLLSGSASAEQLGKVKNVMNQLGIKRITSGTGEIGSPEAALTQIEDLLNTKTTGHMSPQAIHEINEGINTFLENEHEKLKGIADFHAQGAANTFGGNPEEIANKYMLRGMKTPKLIDTRLVTTGDQTELQKMDRGGNASDSKSWKTVDTGQNTQSVTGKGKMGRVERDVIGGLAVGGGLVGHVLGKINHFLGGGTE